jgi:hypothetical protein
MVHVEHSLSSAWVPGSTCTALCAHVHPRWLHLQHLQQAGVLHKPMLLLSPAIASARCSHRLV